MIYANVNLEIKDDIAKADRNIILYKGDKNVELRFIIHDNRFIVLNSTYAQLLIKRPSASPIFSDVAPIQGDAVVFLVTKDMIDELQEIGAYSFQIRLFDDSMEGRVTLPPCEECLIIKEPLAEEVARVDEGMVNYSLVGEGEEEEQVFDEEGDYIKTDWQDGDIITDTRLNKVEDALHELSTRGIDTSQLVGRNMEGVEQTPYTIEEVSGVGLIRHYGDPVIGKVHSETYNDPDNIATGTYSTARGYMCQATGEYSYASGWGSIASGLCTRATGLLATASGPYATCEGTRCKATKNNAHAEGDTCIASGNNAHAEGYRTQATTNQAHSEGGFTVSSGVYSHAEGENSKASGRGAHAEGYYTVASGRNAFAAGEYVTSSGRGQFCIGKYNTANTTDLFIIGCGTANTTEGRMNAHTVNTSGVAWYRGGVYVGGTKQSEGNKLLSTADIYFDADGNLVVSVGGVTKKFAPIE